MSETRILYCHCAYARVVPQNVKEEVLKRLSESGSAFDAVPDLCEMAARRDPALKKLAEDDGEIRIAACYPRAVKWLFAGAGVKLQDQRVQILNMRVDTAEVVTSRLLDTGGAS